MAGTLSLFPLVAGHDEYCGSCGPCGSVTQETTGKKTGHITFSDTISRVYFQTDVPVQSLLRPRRECALYRISSLGGHAPTRRQSLFCSLETLSLVAQGADWARLEGVVLVRNLAYEKRVTARYSLNGWKTFSDVDGQFVSANATASLDRFVFCTTVKCPAQRDLVRMDLAVRYQVTGGEHWDNNDGQNHGFVITWRDP